jgi:hypothetical protein
MIMEAIKALSQPIIEPSAPVGRVSPKASNKLFSPRKVEDTMNQFGPNMHRSQSDEEVIVIDLIELYETVYICLL